MEHPLVIRCVALIYLIVAIVLPVFWIPYRLCEALVLTSRDLAKKYATKILPETYKAFMMCIWGKRITIETFTDRKIRKPSNVYKMYSQIKADAFASKLITEDIHDQVVVTTYHEITDKTSFETACVYNTPVVTNE